MSKWKVLVLTVTVAVVSGLVAVTVNNRLSVPAKDSVDVGFLQDMITHHQQAVQLGSVGAEISTDPTTRHFAQEALISQQYEVGYMTAILESWGFGTGDQNRDAMAWMGAPIAVDDMPGMLTTDQLNSYREMSGDEANKAFLQLMAEHHRGGLHMAVYASKHASDERVRALAARIAKNQRSELAEYARAAESLGFEL
ncbi:MAG TPA: DUF305 domain-containing protein [Microthrixaceae bacterium]|nr:DUF305 domain-containing protein [Microthrixaceae bacterium]